MGLFSFFKNNNNDTLNINSNDELFIKLKSKSTKDKLQNLIIYTTCLSSEPLRNESEHYYDKVNTLLSMKKSACSNEHSYADTLIKNVIYLSNVNHSIKENIAHFLSQNTILTLLQYNNLIAKLEESFKFPNYKYNKHDEEIESTYLKQDDISLLVDELETDFTYNFTYFEILNGTFINLLEHEENNCLLTRNSTDVISLIDYYIRKNSSYLLANIQK